MRPREDVPRRARGRRRSRGRRDRSRRGRDPRSARARGGRPRAAGRGARSRRPRRPARPRTARACPASRTCPPPSRTRMPRAARPPGWRSSATAVWWSHSSRSRRAKCERSAAVPGRIVTPASTGGTGSASRTAYANWRPKPTRNQASTSAAIVGRGDHREPRVALLVPARGGRGEQVARELRLRDRVTGEAAEDPHAAAVVVRRRRAEEVAREPVRAEGRDTARTVARELLRDLRAVVHSRRQQRLDVPVPRVHVSQQAGRLVQVLLGEGDELEGHRRGTIPSLREPEDAYGRGAAARRRPRARGGAVPRRRQQPRLPRLLRAARGAGDDRGLPDERAARVHEHALQAPRRLPAQGRRGRLGHAPGPPSRAARHLQERPPADARPPARAVPALPADRGGVRLPEPRVRGVGGRRRDRDARDARAGGRRAHVRRLDRPRRVPARERHRSA